MLIEGKTKVVYEVFDRPGVVLLQSKDRITAHDGAKSHQMEGKAAYSTSTTCSIFKLLNTAGEKIESVHSTFCVLCQNFMASSELLSLVRRNQDGLHPATQRHRVPGA